MAGNAPKFFAGYAGLWLILAGMANVKQTGALAATLGWTITIGAGVLLLPDALKSFRITGEVIGHPTAQKSDALSEPSAPQSRGYVSPGPFA